MNVYKRRLLKLADFLDQLPEERFNFGTWVGNDWKGKANLSCGTTACALGWATTIPSFRKLGLRLLRNRLSTTHMFTVGLKGHTKGNYLTAIEASKKIFDLSNSEHEFLFVPLSYLNDKFNNLTANSSAKQVSANIRKFVANKYKD